MVTSWLDCQSRSWVWFSAWALEISESYLKYFPLYLTVWTVKYWLKMPGSCVSMLYTGHVKEPDCQFKVRARHTKPDMSVSNVSISLIGAFSESIPLLRSCCNCSGIGCICALVVAILCKAPLNVFCTQRELYKSGIIIILIITLYCWLSDAAGMKV